MSVATGIIDLSQYKKLNDNALHQYFWFEGNSSSAVGGGAHITNIPEADFRNSPTTGGYNSLLNSTGLLIRDGTTVLAQFGQTTFIGKSGSSARFTINADSLTAQNGSGETYLTLSASGLNFGGNSAATQAALNTEINERKATYGTCSTATGTGSTQASPKEVVCSNFTLYPGAVITVTFSNSNTVASPYMRVNSTATADSKPIKSFKGGSLTSAEYSWAASSSITFVYDGTYWRMQDGGALQAKADAANSATAAAEVVGGYTILWNYSTFSTKTDGKAYLCAFDPLTGMSSDANGWVKWNNTRITIPKNTIYHNNRLPYDTNIYIVCRIGVSSNTNYLVYFLDDGWKYNNIGSTSSEQTWNWDNSNDIILGSFIVKESIDPLPEYEIFNPPRTSKHLTTSSLDYAYSDDVNNLISGTPYWQYTDDTDPDNPLVYDVFYNKDTGVYYYITTDDMDVETTHTINESDLDKDEDNVLIINFKDGLQPLNSQLEILQGDHIDLTDRVELIEESIQIKPNGDEDDATPYIRITSGAASTTSTKFTPTKIEFLKDSDPLLYISSEEEEGIIDINSARIHDFIRIGGMEIFVADEEFGGIGIRKGRDY